ncbi:MAG TPA: LacI family DNA-binding transcriptional regulator [Terriglobales bacterium]|nr:LacI family DNA-binding transcriptional regulator [Terriglobales bacterium]
MQSSEKLAKASRERITLKVLARHLGLSSTTVSVVLSGSPLASTIADSTKARIWEAVEKFEYRPNLFARYLQAKRTYSIAVLVPEIGDEFSSMLISGIESKLAKENFNYLVESHHFAPEQIEDSPETLMDHQVEGMIFINTPLRKRMPVPVVAISDITRAPGVRRIVIDNYEAVRLGLEHLKALGHKKIAFFKGPEHNGDSEARAAAVFSVAAESGIEVQLQLTATLGTYYSAKQISMMQRGYDAATAFIQRSTDFTAIMAFNDKSAVGAIRAIHDHGLRVPEDLSVIGMDDLPLAAFMSPRLSTIRQPLKAMGAAGATTLLKLIQGHEVPEETVIGPELVIRESTGPVRTRRIA